MLGVVLSGFIAVENRALCVIVCDSCFVDGERDILLVEVLDGPFVMLCCLLMVDRCRGVMLGSGEAGMHRGDHFGRFQRKAENRPRGVRQSVAVVLGIISSCFISAMDGLHRMSMGIQCLMCSVSIVFADLIVLRSLAMKLCSLLVMNCRRDMVFCYPVFCSHEFSSRPSRLWRAELRLLDLAGRDSESTQR